MRAWRFHEYGEPADVLILEDVPPPRPRPSQVVIRVHAAPVNFADAVVIRGEYQTRPVLPAVPGMEVCGVVMEVGSRVSHSLLGTRVIGMPAAGHGSYAEYTVLDATDVLPAPEVLDDACAASLFIAYQTSFFGLHRRGRLLPGETLLVHAAAGGVGSAAVQLGRAAGARVIGVVGGPAKARFAIDAGCDVVVDRQAQDIVAAVMEATDGRGADVVYDPVGGEAFTASTRFVAWEGRIVVVGFASGIMARARTEHLMVKNYSIMGLHWGRYRIMDPSAVRSVHHELSRLAATGQVSPMVSQRPSFELVPQSITAVATGATTGRVVVTVSACRDDLCP